jgi:hypothetical protein
MLTREPQATLFETCPVQRDKSCIDRNQPPIGLYGAEGNWVRELQPDSRFMGVLIMDEYKEALQVILDWFLHGNEVTEIPEGSR